MRFSGNRMWRNSERARREWNCFCTKQKLLFSLFRTISCFSFCHPLRHHTLSDRWPVDFFFLLILPLLLPTVALRCRCCCCWRTPLVTSIEHLILFLYSIPYFFFVFVQFLYNSLCICCMLCVCVWNGIWDMLPYFSQALLRPVVMTIRFEIPFRPLAFGQLNRWISPLFLPMPSVQCRQ